MCTGVFQIKSNVYVGHVQLYICVQVSSKSSQTSMLATFSCIYVYRCLPNQVKRLCWPRSVVYMCTGVFQIKSKVYVGHVQLYICVQVSSKSSQTFMLATFSCKDNSRSRRTVFH
ncbi:hypothetical protein BgiMline_002492, partial [Biomphalaria glabrata]